MSQENRVFFKTFGCRTNIFDTSIMVENLNNFKIVDEVSQADKIVINSCTVTNSADANVRQFVNSMRKNHPEKEIIFTGCGTTTQGKKLLESKKIDKLFPLSEKEKISRILDTSSYQSDFDNLNFIDKTIVTDIIGKSRAFIKIQEGCNFKCSYCIIPSVRGNSRSYSIEHILQQIRTLTQQNFSEFILTGTNIGSFQIDENSKYKKSRSDLAILLKEISKISGVKRIRLGSVEPSQINNSEFLEITSERWLEKHLHIALQYTDNEMLKIMNRKNRVESDLELFSKLADKNFAIGTDFIVGHPFESEEIFKNGFENLKKFSLTHIHLFTFSPRDFTKSAELMKQNRVDPKISKERFAQIDDLIKNKNRAFQEKIREKNIPLEVLFETQKDGLFYGLDQFFNPVYFKSDLDLTGKWQTIEHKL